MGEGLGIVFHAVFVVSQFYVAARKNRCWVQRTLKTVVWRKCDRSAGHEDRKSHHSACAIRNQEQGPRISNTRLSRVRLRAKDWSDKRRMKDIRVYK